MAESVIGAEVNGTTYNKNIHTAQRTIGGVAKEDQYLLTAEPYNGSYTAIAKTISTATSASHLLMIMGDGTNYVRLTRFFVRQVVAAGSATLAELSLFRLSTAGSGGTTVNARPHDEADTNPFGGVVQTLPSSKGTEGTELWHDRLWLTNSIAAQPNSTEWPGARDFERVKPFICGTATTDGLALKIVTGIASATVDIMFEFTLTTYL